MRVAILFGGRSEEHDVSVKSAMEIAANIDTARYEPVYVGITRTGLWRQCARPDPEWEDRDGRSAVISPDRSTHGLLVGAGERQRVLRLDVVFPVLHGRAGEDGTVQGLLELSGVPYVGCDVQSSAICMDKELAYVVAGSAGIHTPECSVLDADDVAGSAALTYPVFVKPARSGSSFGVTRVDHARELRAAITTARAYDHKVLVEQVVTGTEVGCAVLGNGNDVITGEVDQIVLTHGFFRIHQEAAPERGSENARITVPAELPDATRARIREMAQRIYAALGCGGLARVDMFLRDDGTLVLNEVNTLPGFTSYSRYPRMMAAVGMSLTEVIDRLIASATDR